MSKWIVLASGILMCVVGLWWLWDGLGIVQVERGWSAVIAGAVIFSAGAVLMGLSALIRQVEALVFATRAPAPAAFLAGAGDPPQSPALPAAPEQQRVESAAQTRADMPPLVLPRAGVPDFSMASQPRLEAGLRLADHEAGKTAAGKDKLEAASGLPEGETTKREKPKLYASQLEPPQNASAAAHWKTLLARASASDKNSVPEMSSPVAPEAPAPGIQNQSNTVDAEGRIARRYESQGVRYSLFEDGSIEAETDAGLYRFASLTELRTFLDQRQG